MMYRTVLSTIAALSLSGCGSSGSGPTPVSPPIASKPDVIITFDGVNHACVVALYTEPQGSTIPCADLISFMKDELRVKTGAIYDTKTTGKPDEVEVTKTTQSLKDAGYRFIGGH